MLLLHLVLQKCFAVNTGMPASAEAENVNAILILALALDRREFLAYLNGATHSIFFPTATRAKKMDTSACHIHDEIHIEIPGSDQRTF